MRVALPDEVRPQLRAIAAGVANTAQEAYRRRLRLVSPEDDEASLSGEEIDPQGWTLGEVWVVISEVLGRELREHPELLDRVLVALANARPRNAHSEAVESA
jgi:hypothetical protein